MTRQTAPTANGAPASAPAGAPAPRALVETPVENRFERITRLTRRLFEARIVLVALLDDDRAWFKSAQGTTAVDEPRAGSFVDAALASDGVLVLTDVADDPRFAANAFVTGDTAIETCAAAAIRPDGATPAGALCVMHDAPREWDDDDRQLLSDLTAMIESELASIACGPAQAELIAETPLTRRRTLIDPVTRLWNRTGIAEVMGRQLRWSGDAGTNTAVMLVEVDGAERFEAFEDQMVRSVGLRVLGAVRETDAVGRWGDARYMVVCGGDIASDQVMAVAQRLRQRVGARPLHLESDALHAITVSIGIAFAAATAATVDDLAQDAAAALLRARAAGGDRVER